MGTQIRCYDYVNHPYERVRDSLRKDPSAVFRDATKAAESRAESVAAELRVDLGGIVIGADIVITVTGLEEKPAGIGTNGWASLHLAWQAARLPGLFPLMRAELALYPITARETQLEFLGVYEPPVGALGSVLNAVGGYRIADASVHRFVSSVAEHLRQTLG